MPRDRYEDEDDDDRPRRRRDDDDDRPRRRTRDEDDDQDEDDRPRRSRRRRDDDDDFDRPAPKAGNGMAVAALVLGLVSILFGPCTGLIGLILGVIGLRKPSGKGMAVTGLLLGGLFSITHTAGGIWAFLKVREAAEKFGPSTLNLKQIGIGTHNYHDVNGYMPEPFVRRQGEFPGQPVTDLNDRLAWRVHILPYIEQDNIYRQVRVNERWDSPANLPLSNIPVMQYSDPDARADPNTRVRCFYDNGAIFDTRAKFRMTEITDGMSNTMLCVEGAEKVTWSRFQEYKFEPNGPLPALGRPEKNGFTVLLADGSTRWVKKTVDEKTLKAMITRAGGEVVTLDK
jgi:hypothetical protein